MADGRMRPGDANVARLKPRDREYAVRDTRVPALGVRVAPAGRGAGSAIPAPGG